ncbi:AbgT family transporter [Vibrio lentus]|nr:AbgT family transporter [Vibrio lentus]
MMYYFGLILAVATRYMKNLGIGTLIATMLPYQWYSCSVGASCSTYGYSYSVYQ